MIYRILVLTIVFLITISADVRASIFCPADKTIYCNEDRHYLPLTGKPIVFGYPIQLLRYIDTDFINNCNVGYVQRRWFVDVNQDGIWQSDEGSCFQTIYLLALTQQVNVYFPADKIYNCKSSILNDKPSWDAGPCDVMGYSVKDEVFEIASDACYKIMRTFTVINWCTYHPQSPNWNGQGIWTHKQVIKVIENEAPEFNDCEPVVFNTSSDCKAEIVLVKSALDNAECPSQLLSWVVEVDLWSNGTVDYKYGFTESGEFLIAPVANGAQISVRLPERVGVGKHKVKWAVRDQCGNFRSCNTFFEVKDQKAPTPYMYALLTSAFRGDQMNLEVNAKLFDVGSFDNCTHKSKLKFSFSKDTNDTTRVINCANLGFQYFTIYVTDLAGNSDFAEVFMLVFDNGSCNFGFTFPGKVTSADGRSLSDIEITLNYNSEVVKACETDENGSFYLEDVSLMEDYHLEVQRQNNDEPVVNILDFLLLKNYIFGLGPLENYQYIAADVNQDGRIRSTDLIILRDYLLGRETALPGWKYFADIERVDSEKDLSSLSTNPMLTDFDGCFDFTAVFPGDITGTKAPETELRTNIYLTLKETEYGFNLYSENGIQLEGMQLALPIESIGKDIEVWVSGVRLNANQYHLDKTGKILYILLAEKISSSSEQFTLTVVNANLVLDKTSIDSRNIAVTTGGHAFKIGIHKELVTSNRDLVYPNPSLGEFNISDPELVITGVYCLDGKPVDFYVNKENLSMNTFAGGIFILRALKNGKEVQQKLVIMR